MNIKSWLSPEGLVIDMPIKRASVSEAVVFSPFCNSSHITPDSSISDCISAVLGIVFANPPYMRQEEKLRHASLLKALSDFPLPAHFGRKGQTLAGDEKVVRLDCIMPVWVESYYDKKYHPLLASLALDTAGFLRKHLFGHSSYEHEGTNWRISALLNKNESDREAFCSDRLDSAQFKKDMTEGNIGSTLVRVKIPAGEKLAGVDKKLVINEGCELLFEIKRCHLSSGSPYDYSLFLPEIANPPQFDISKEFAFYGDVLLRGEGLDLKSVDGGYCPLELLTVNPTELSKSRYELPGEIPARWIISSFRERYVPPKIEFVEWEMPKWERIGGQ